MMRRIVWFSFACLFALSVEAGAKKKSRYSFKRDKEVGAKVLIDSKGGLQFACKRCRMKTYKIPKATETEPAWEGFMTSPEKIVIRWMLEESDSPYGTDAAALTTHLQAQADLRKDPDPAVRQYEPVIYGPDLLDSMGIAQAGGDISVIWPQRKKWHAEKIFVIVAGKRRYTLSMRYRNRHMKRGQVANLETLFQQELKVRNP